VRRAAVITHGKPVTIGPALERLEKVARPSGAVGAVEDVKAYGAIHKRPWTEAEKRSIRLEVDAEEVSLHV